MNVKFKNLTAEEDLQDLDEVFIDQNWQLLFIGEPADTFAAFLQSDKKITQIAPLKAQGCNCKIEPSTQAVVYPQDTSLGFDQTEGPGWRRFIVVRAKHLPIPPRDPRNTTITSQELENFARRILDQKDNKVAVQSYEFELVC